MPVGPDVTPMFNNPPSGHRNLAHFFLAINISSFTNLNQFKNKLKNLMDNLRSNNTIDSKYPIMCPGESKKIPKKLD